ncbi:glutathione S-transferase U17-like [Apium graveolens]|uniref:glutathione S-transferase U17-like n=1 Tax=Apium graveolens TaxID=4045 RepID=UPI003D7AB614
MRGSLQSALLVLSGTSAYMMYSFHIQLNCIQHFLLYSLKMSTRSVKLLGSFFCPYANRVKIALNLKSVAFDYLEEKMCSKSNLLLISNPVYQKVPVLIHDDKIICESLVIVEYIDQVWMDNGYSILPSDPYDRSVARFWAAYVDDKLVLTLKDLLSSQGEDTIAVKERLEEAISALEVVFLKCSKGKAYFGGDDIGFIDIALGSCLQWIKTVEQVT